MFFFVFRFIVFLRSLCTLQLALTYSLAFFWPLVCLLHIEFYSKIRVFFWLLNLFFLSSDHYFIPSDFVLFNWIQHPSVWLTSQMPPPIEFTLFAIFSLLLILLFVLIDLFSLSVLILFLFYFSFIFSFSSFVFFISFHFQALYSSFPFPFVWTSGLSFCLIILVFARMSLRVNFTARRFLMILHCLLGQRKVEAAGVFNSSVKKITRNPHFW